MATNTGKFSTMKNLYKNNASSLLKNKWKGASQSTNLFKSNPSVNKSSSSSTDKVGHYTVPNTSTTTKKKSSSKGYSGGGGGGYSAPDYHIDLSNILADYSNAAEAQKQTIRDTTASTIKALESSEASQRSTLSKALERFQEDTAKQRKQQQSNFNSSRADLEAQAYLANRQAIQQAAARGLGGSGLQQLAQLQNLINEGKETSNLAQSNTDVQNEISQALARQEEDTTKSLNELAANLAAKKEELNKAQVNQLNEIDKNTASLKSQLQYNEEVRAQEAERQAKQFAAQLAAQNAAASSSWAMYNRQREDEANDLMNATISGLAGALKSAELDMQAAARANSGKGTKAAKNNNKAVEAARSKAASNMIKIFSASGADRSYLDSYTNSLNDLFNRYYRD